MPNGSVIYYGGSLDANYSRTCFAQLIPGRKCVDSPITLACDGSFEASPMTCCTCQIIETNEIRITYGGNLDSCWMYIGCGKDLICLPAGLPCLRAVHPHMHTGLPPLRAGLPRLPTDLPRLRAGLPCLRVVHPHMHAWASPLARWFSTCVPHL